MKRSAEIVHMEYLRPPMPVVMITGKTKQDVARKAGRGVARGQFGSVSEVLPVAGGGYAAKAYLIPRPARKSRKFPVRAGLVIAAVASSLSALFFAASALLGALLALPWMTILGALGALALLLLATRPGRSVVRVIVDVTVR